MARPEELVAKELEELQKVVSEFVLRFELVFDNDWDATKDRIVDPLFIENNGTFINPNTDDESNNWGNRGSLLSSYRNLIKVMKRQNILKSIDEL